MGNHFTLEERISRSYPTLSPQERRAANALMEHLDDLGMYRATELAALADVSKATFSRLVRRLDYQDFEAMREQLRALRQSGVPVSTATPGLSAQITQDVANLNRLLATLDEAIVDEIARQAARARRVVIHGQRNSFGMASLLRMNLAQIRPDTSLIPQPGQSAADDIVDLGPEDLAIVMSFRRHSSAVGDLVDVLSGNNVPTAVIADEQLRTVAHRATWFIECPMTSPGAFDSHAVAMSLVAVLSDRVLSLVPDGPERIDRVDGLLCSLHDTADR